MDNDSWKCAGAKLEAGTQLIPAAAAFLPAVSTSSTLLPSSSSILSTWSFSHRIQCSENEEIDKLNFAIFLSKLAIKRYFANCVISFSVRCADKCEFYCHAVRWIRFSSHFNFFCSVRLQNNIVVNKVDLLHVFTRPSLCMSSIYWAWFCGAPSEKSLFSEIKHLYAKKAFKQIFVLLKPKFCKVDFRSFEQPWVDYPNKTLPFRPKKKDTDKAMFDVHCSSFQRLAVSCQDGSHNEHLAPHRGGAHRRGGPTWHSLKFSVLRALLIMTHSLDLLGTHDYLVDNTGVFW